jgi:hypothetical protein
MGRKGELQHGEFIGLKDEGGEKVDAVFVTGASINMPGGDGQPFLGGNKGLLLFPFCRTNFSYTSIRI